MHVVCPVYLVPCSPQCSETLLQLHFSHRAVQPTGVPLVDELMKLPTVAAAAQRSLHLLLLLGGVATCGRWVRAGRPLHTAAAKHCCAGKQTLLFLRMAAAGSNNSLHKSRLPGQPLPMSPPTRSLLLRALDTEARRRIRERGAAHFNLVATLLASAAKPCQVS